MEHGRRAGRVGCEGSAIECLLGAGLASVCFLRVLLNVLIIGKVIVLRVISLKEADQD